MDFLEAFEAPIVERVGGIPISFPVNLIEDYTTWAAELATAKRDTARKLLPRFDPVSRQPANMDATQKWNIDQRIESIECGLEDVAERIWTIPGAMRVLEISLAKTDYSEQDRKLIIKRIKPQRLHLLARDVSGLFERIIPVSAKAEGQPDPNLSSPVPNVATGDAATGQ